MPTASAAADRLREILQVGKLTGLRSIGEVGRQLSELARCRGVSLRLGRLRGALQVGGDLRRHLLVFGRVRLLKLLKDAGQLREWRELRGVRCGHRRRYARVTRGGRAGIGSGALESDDQYFLQIIARKIAYRTSTHELLIGALAGHSRRNSAGPAAGLRPGGQSMLPPSKPPNPPVRWKCRRPTPSA